MANIRKHVIIKGRIQGVWFRATTQEHALSYGLTGWVKNTWDGNVEAVFEGEEENEQIRAC
jgi:acylphosphatase